MTKATDISTWRATCTELAREAREWEAVARYLASCLPRGRWVLARLIAERGLTDYLASPTIPTDSEGIE